MPDSSAFDMAAPSQNHGETSCLIEQGGEPSGTPEAVSQPTQLEVEKALSLQDHLKQQTTFRDLPAELRNMIWHAALEPRVVILKPKRRNAETDSPTGIDFNNIPGMLFANRESRLIALYHYDQRFTLTFSSGVPGIQPDGSTSSLICRIPVIVSAHDEIAFSRSQIRTQIEYPDLLRFSIDTAVGASQPRIKRFSILGDWLMRPGINAEQLARLLDHMDTDYLEDHIFSVETIGSDPFKYCSEPELPEWCPEALKPLCIGMQSRTGMSLYGCLGLSFGHFCRREIYFMDWGPGCIDARVYHPALARLLEALGRSEGGRNR